MEIEQAALLAQLTPDAQPPPPAANPSPGGGAAPPPSHPSYAEMIKAAIEWGSSQGKEGGSSKRAIAKYIDRVYTNLPTSHSALLTHHLKRLKSLGQLVMVKNSYQLPSAVPYPPPPPRSAPAAAPASPVPPNSTPKRGPGRPAKPKPVAPPVSSDSVLDNGAGSEPAKKRRGRPPRQQQEGAVAAEVPFVQPISEVRPNLVNGEAAAAAATATAGSGQKRRGRPLKLQQQPPPLPVVPFVYGAQQPVVQVTEEVVVEELPKRRPGRPPKQANVVGPERPVEGSARPRGRPKKNPLGPVSRPVGKPPRGRPRKLSGAVSGGALGIGMGMRRGRGRPPKGAGPPKVRRRTGRPLGRPRKDASTLRNHTSDQAANEELLRQFELIQSKIREAVVIIRPCVANEGPALMALQQLEELTTVDLTAPPIAPSSPPATRTMPQGTTAPPTPALPVSIAPASTGSPAVNVSAPFMAPFNVSEPPMSVTAPFHAPSGMESQHQMSWMPSNEAQS